WLGRYHLWPFLTIWGLYLEQSIPIAARSPFVFPTRINIRFGHHYDASEQATARYSGYQRPALRQRAHSSWAPAGIHSDRYLGALPEDAWPQLLLRLRR